jgi:hypothetical protein
MDAVNMPKGPKIKMAPLSIKIPEPLKAAIVKVAADDYRSISSLVEKILSDYLKEHGHLRK